MGFYQAKLTEGDIKEEPGEEAAEDPAEDPAEEQAGGPCEESNEDPAEGPGEDIVILSICLIDIPYCSLI